MAFEFGSFIVSLTDGFRAFVVIFSKSNKEAAAWRARLSIRV